MELLEKWDEQLKELIKCEFGDMSYDEVSLKLGIPQKTIRNVLRKEKKKVTFSVYYELFDLFYHELVIEKGGYVYSGDLKDIYSAIIYDYGDMFTIEERSFMKHNIVNLGMFPSYKLAIDSLYRNGFNIKFVKCVDN